MATTATVTLDYVYLHEVADLSNYLRLSADDLVEGTTGSADVRLYGQGNVRRRSAPGVVHTAQIRFELVTRAEKEQLLEWIDADTFLLMRDPRGRVWYGGFASKSLSVTEYAAVDRSVIQGTFEAVTPPADPVAS